jgi:hypothetical protein
VAAGRPARCAVGCHALDLDLHQHGMAPSASDPGDGAGLQRVRQLGMSTLPVLMSSSCTHLSGISSTAATVVAGAC